MIHITDLTVKSLLCMCLSKSGKNFLIFFIFSFNFVLVLSINQDSKRAAKVETKLSMITAGFGKVNSKLEASVQVQHDVYSRAAADLGLFVCLFVCVFDEYFVCSSLLPWLVFS